MGFLQGGPGTAGKRRPDGENIRQTIYADQGDENGQINMGCISGFSDRCGIWLGNVVKVEPGIRLSRENSVSFDKRCRDKKEGDYQYETPGNEQKPD